MRKNKNNVRVCGYLYSFCANTRDELKVITTKAGKEMIVGTMEIATDRDCTNIVPVRFMMSPTYGNADDAKANRNYPILKRMLELVPYPTVMDAGIEHAQCIRVDGQMELNDWIDDENQRQSARRIGGSFVTLLNNESELPALNQRATFELDVLLTKATRHESDPEKASDYDRVEVRGGAFNYRNEILPTTFTTTDPEFMDGFESLEYPYYTKIAGEIHNTTIMVNKTEESLFGSPRVTTVPSRDRRWEINHINPIPYEITDGEPDSSTITITEIQTLNQNRETHWATVKADREAYLANRNKPAPAAGSFAATAAKAANAKVNVDF